MHRLALLIRYLLNRVNDLLALGRHVSLISPRDRLADPDDLQLVETSELISIQESLKGSCSVLDTLRQRWIAELAGKHNRSAAVNRLPTETLSHILEFVQGDRFLTLRAGGNRYKQRRNPFHHDEWLEVTLVCRHWRQVALANPSVWNKVVVRSRHNPKFPLLWLRRAGDVPLDVYIDALHGLALPIVDEISSRCSQFRRLDIGVIDDPRRLSCFNFPGSRLKHLTLGATERQNSTIVLPRLFAACTPHLTPLFTHATCVFPANVFGSLTHITIECLQDLKLHELLSFLQANLYAEALVLRHCSLAQGFQAEDTNERAPALRLPALKEIAMGSCDATLVREMLARMEPASSDVAVVCRFSDMRRGSVANLPAKEPWAPCLSLCVQALDIVDTGSQVSMLVADRSSRSTFWIGQSCERREDVHILQNFLFSAVGSMDLSSLRELRLSCDTGRRDLARWRAVFSNMHYVTDVVLTLTTLEWLPTLVGDSPNEDTGSPYPLPGLRNLTFVPETWSRDSGTTELVIALKDMLEVRHSSGHPISHLRVVGDFSFVCRRQERWQALANESSALGRYVEELEFESLEFAVVKGDEYPDMHFPGAKWIAEQQSYYRSGADL